jgi:hypothetical protein
MAAGMLGNLPAAVTTFAACPVPVGVAGDRGSGSGSGGDAAAVLAVVTAAGTLEVATLRRGALSPLSATVTLSLGERHSGVETHLSCMLAGGIAMRAAAESAWADFARLGQLGHLLSDMGALEHWLTIMSYIP